VSTLSCVTLTNNMESRVVLEYKQHSRPNLKVPLGRGALGNGTYGWALLDDW
jgi:hypothetical protein